MSVGLKPEIIDPREMELVARPATAGMEGAIIPMRERGRALPAPRTVESIDLYGALLADARSPRTRVARMQDVADLARFLEIVDPRETVALLTGGTAGQANAIALGYNESMRLRELAPATINRRLSTLRRLAKLGRRLGLVDWTLDVDGVGARPYRDTAGPGRDGMGAIIATAKALATDTKGRRDWALVSLLYSAGLRRAEAAAVDVADLDLQQRRVRIIGKGRSDAEWLPMSKAAATAVTAWLAIRGHVPGPLFIALNRGPRSKHSRLSGRGIHFIIAELGRRAGLARPLHPHQLRHASITRLAERTNGDMRLIREFSRHSNISTVAIYCDRVREASASLAELLGEDL